MIFFGFWAFWTFIGLILTFLGKMTFTLNNEFSFLVLLFVSFIFAVLSSVMHCAFA